MLSNIRIVLVGTTHPGNIGAAARAMKTMGLHSLALVSPKTYPSAEATARASGADDVLAAASVHQTLDQALVGCRLVVGASARMRSLEWSTVSPQLGAETLVKALPEGPVAMVFGREHSGLSNEELGRCHHLLHIPANPDYSSLNLAAAVQVVAWEIRKAYQSIEPGTVERGAVEEKSEHQIAPAEEMERFYVHLRDTMIDTGFMDPDNPKHLLQRMRRLFNRARPDQNEINILRGVLTSAQQHVSKRGSK